MKFTLEIELGNDGMQTTGNIAEALHKVARKLHDIDSYEPIGDEESGGIMDANGNTVGKWEVSE